MRFSMLSVWRRLRPRPIAPGPRIIVYTRAECGCCRKAIALLRGYRRRFSFSLEEVDVDAVPELRALYDTTVPVVAVDGKVRFKGVVNPVLLERLLVAEGKSEKRGRS